MKSMEVNQGIRAGEVERFLTWIGDDSDAKNDLNDFDDPVGGEEEEKAGDGISNLFFTFVLSFWGSGVGEHLKASQDEYDEEKKTAEKDGDGEKTGAGVGNSWVGSAKYLSNEGTAITKP